MFVEKQIKIKRYLFNYHGRAKNYAKLNKWTKNMILLFECLQGFGFDVDE